ncbi:hypothetical protein GCM10022255_026770 [Dactylosporangium darangshiense]|uniref:Anti-sigma K factor RskA C-terminal domain-containing protein n=1 Tax=Dactylosporangium darangshiense TaxID=579108 RepID=A0ABP8D5Y3_9ACTN
MPHLEPERLVLLALGEEALDQHETGHLDACDQCRADMDSLRNVAGLGRQTQRLRELPPPPEHVWRRIRAELAASGRGDPPPAVGLHSDPPPPRPGLTDGAGDEQADPGAESTHRTGEPAGPDDARTPPGDTGVPEDAMPWATPPGNTPWIAPSAETGWEAPPGDTPWTAPSGEAGWETPPNDATWAVRPDADAWGTLPGDDAAGGEDPADVVPTARLGASHEWDAFGAADERDTLPYSVFQPDRVQDRPLHIGQVRDGRDVADDGAGARRARGGGRAARGHGWGLTAAVATAAAIVAAVAGAGVGVRVVGGRGSGDAAAECRAQDSRVRLEALPGAPAGASGYACVRTSGGQRRIVVRADGMPVQIGADYEAWLIDDSGPGERVAALGVLGAGPDLALAVPATVDLSQYHIIEISVEPHDGDAGPSGRSMLRGRLS